MRQLISLPYFCTIKGTRDAVHKNFFDGLKYTNYTWHIFLYGFYYQKQPTRGVFWKRCSEICSKSTGEYSCRSAISIKLLKSHFGMGVLL